MRLKLKDVIKEIDVGEQFEVKDKKEKGNTAVIEFKNLSNPFIKEVSYLNLKNEIRKNVKLHDSLMVRASYYREDVGKCYLYLGEEECSVGRKIYILRHDQNPIYINCVLNSTSIKRQINRFIEISSSGRWNTITKENLLEIEIPLPPKKVQDQITTKLQNLINTKFKLDETLDKLLKTRKKQYDYYRDLLIVKGNIEEYPTLQEVISKIYGGNIEITNKLLGNKNYQIMNWNKIKTPILFENDSELKNFINPIKNKKYCEFGDVLIKKIGGSIKEIGKAIAYIEQEKGLPGDGIWVIKHNQNPQYLDYALSTKFCRKEIKKVSTKTTRDQWYLGKDEIKNIRIPIPSLEEQEKIVEKLNQIRDNYENLKLTIKEIKKIRDIQMSYYNNKLVHNL